MDNLHLNLLLYIACVSNLARSGEAYIFFFKPILCGTKTASFTTCCTSVQGVIGEWPSHMSMHACQLNLQRMPSVITLWSVVALKKKKKLIQNAVALVSKQNSCHFFVLMLNVIKCTIHREKPIWMLLLSGRNRFLFSISLHLLNLLWTGRLMLKLLVATLMQAWLKLHFET